MPASCRIAGLTKTMYAIVMNVVKPARISVRQFAFNAANSKYRSSDARRDMKFHCRRGKRRPWREPDCCDGRTGDRFLSPVFRGQRQATKTDGLSYLSPTTASQAVGRR